MPGIRVRDVVRDVVAEVAEQELPLVIGLSRFSEAVVVRRLARTKGRRETLGFGVGEVVPLVTAAVWLVLDQTAQQAAGLVVTGSLGRLRTWWRRLRRRPSVAVVPPLTQEQLREVHQRVIDVGGRRGLSRRQSEVVADAVVARLALGAPTGGEVRALGPDDGAAGGRA
ncbi:hypothetical protein C5N14_14830 [Micromonospora sp. MW-13]|uniref:hypothetical protein n=1 Tax=Micromonospora sp. MW-13 TaxID=2094022 RepID=UPI000E43A9D4|nr:hypothetical protein [Micromonospora sp. MW-13]RGC68191.1 hypothetical protein C5N14_14830 [Micromonospora sp. MW-13]